MSGHAYSGSARFSRCDSEVEALARPIGVRIQWRGSTGGHFVAITGVSSHSRQHLVVEDPDYGQVILPHSTVDKSYQSNPSASIGFWDCTYFTK